MPWASTGNIKGPPGPTAVSADPNNAAVLSPNDSLIWVDATQMGAGVSADADNALKAGSDRLAYTTPSVDANNAIVLGADGYLYVDGTVMGLPGTRGSLWYTGVGAPTTIAGELPNDQYLDTTTGDVYTFT